MSQPVKLAQHPHRPHSSSSRNHNSYLTHRFNTGAFNPADIIGPKRWFATLHTKAEEFIGTSVCKPFTLSKLLPLANHRPEAYKGQAIAKSREAQLLTRLFRPVASSHSSSMSVKRNVNTYFSSPSGATRIGITFTDFTKMTFTDFCEHNPPADKLNWLEMTDVELEM